MTRRRFSLLAASLPLSLAGLRNAAAQVPQEWADRQKEQERLRAIWQEAMRLPISSIVNTHDRRLFSSSVNSVLCWADVGDKTWLGTRLGIKCVSKKPGAAPRYYTQLDGLPGDRVFAVVADDRGVFALVDSGSELEALCVLEPKTDRWKVLERWPKGRPDVNLNQEDGYLALGAEVVLASRSYVTTQGPSPLLPIFCFGRDDEDRRALPWDEAFRADHLVFRVGYLACDAKTLMLGTSVGLLEVPLSADGGPWTRHLPNQVVASGRSGGGRLYLLLQRRVTPSFSPLSFDGARSHLYDPKTRELEPLPPGEPRQQVEAVVDVDGALWLRRRWQAGGASEIITSDRQPDDAAFYRWRPGDSAWARLRPDGSDSNKSPSPTAERNRRIDFGLDFNLPAVAAPSAVPDLPARLAALDASTIPQSDPFGMYMNTSVSPSPVRWLKERFPHWLGLDNSVSVPASLQGMSLVFTEAVAAPQNPEIAWVGREPGALTSFPRSSLSAPPLPSAGESEAAGSRRLLNPPKTAPLAKVLLPKRMFRTHVNARQVLPLARDLSLILSENAPFLVSEHGGRWERVTLPPNPGFGGNVMLTPSDRAFAVGGDIFLAYWLEKSLLRLDRKAQAFVSTGISRERLYNFAGADESGAWWRTGDRLTFLEAGATEVRERKPKHMPDGLSLYDLCGIAEGCLWWQGNLAGKQVLIGWNHRAEKWSAPLPLEYVIGNLAVASDGRGGAYVALRPRYDAKEVVVHRWDAKSDGWSVVTTIPTATIGENLRLVAVGGDGVWLADDRSLRRYSPKSKATEQFSLPFVDPPTVYGMRRDLLATPDDIFELTDGGLYRLDRRRRTWEEWKRPVSSTEVRAQVLASDEQNVWGKVVAPSAVVPPLFRFDPATLRFDFFDEAAGLPEQAEGKLILAGKSIWFLHGTGAFRFNEPSGKFIREAQLRAELLTFTGDGETVWIAGYRPLAKGLPAVYRWDRASGKTTLEKPSEEIGNGCRALLASGRGVLLATWRGLFRSEKPDVWEPVDTLGLIPSNLRRDPGGAIWVSDGANILRIDARAGL